jgi:maleylpyruvate isomerase
MVGSTGHDQERDGIVNKLMLHGYWRSTASYRVRIALALKGVAFEQSPHDLRLGAQRDARFLALAPHGLVPVLETEDGPVTQSLAILEWLEERFPVPALLPVQPGPRAIVRAMAATVACDIHPLNNLRVLNALRADFSASQDQVEAWIVRWVCEGFTALEVLIGRHGGAFAYGDFPSFADCCLVPQVYAARRFKVDLRAFPATTDVAQRAAVLGAFATAHPDNQSDAD